MCMSPPIDCTCEGKFKRNRKKNFRTLTDAFVVFLPAQVELSRLNWLYTIICMRRLGFSWASSAADRWKKEEFGWARISCHSANLIFCQHSACFTCEFLFGEKRYGRAHCISKQGSPLKWLWRKRRRCSESLTLEYPNEPGSSVYLSIQLGRRMRSQGGFLHR